jgi:pyruvate carboxylase
VVEALRFTPRATELSPDNLRRISRYWEDVRKYYAAFESGMNASSAFVYCHEMPGGQYSNLYEQAQALGVGDRWDEVCAKYADVNQLLGDIVKVTPTSKVVGDMALFMVANNLTSADVLEGKRELAFPESVVDLLSGKMGQAPGGFPARLRQRVLRGEKPLRGRPGASLPPADFAAATAKVEKLLGTRPSDRDVVSYLLYPRVYADFVAQQQAFSDMSVFPTPAFFYGMQPGEDISVDIEPGKTLIIKFLTVGDPHPDGRRTVFFELNGQARSVTVLDNALETESSRRPKADPNDPSQVAAPMPGLVVAVAVRPGNSVTKGEKLLTLEAMKMETTLYAPRDGKIAEILVTPATQVEMGDLLVKLQ